MIGRLKHRRKIFSFIGQQTELQWGKNSNRVSKKCLSCKNTTFFDINQKIKLIINQPTNFSIFCKNRPNNVQHSWTYSSSYRIIPRPTQLDIFFPKPNNTTGKGAKIRGHKIPRYEGKNSGQSHRWVWLAGVGHYQKFWKINLYTLFYQFFFALLLCTRIFTICLQTFALDTKFKIIKN